MQSINTQQQTQPGSSPVMHSPAMDIFQRMANDLDTEGRYLFLNALANQLRYPNNHTHYFSCVLLFLFAEAKQVTILCLEASLTFSCCYTATQVMT